MIAEGHWKAEPTCAVHARCGLGMSTSVLLEGISWAIRYVTHAELSVDPELPLAKALAAYTLV